MKAGAFLSRRLEPVQHYLKEMIVQLAQGQVEFIVAGGVSAILHGSTHTTTDLDVCYRRTPANIARIVATLAPLKPRPRNLPSELPFVFDERTLQLGANFTFVIGDEFLDLLGDMSAIGGYED